jgi:hypothetical protein
LAGAYINQPAFLGSFSPGSWIVPMLRPVLCVSLLALIGGCFSSATGTVSGRVTFNGKPLEKGLITFSPTGAKGGTAGGEIVAGRFEVKELVPAPYQVSVAAVPELKIVMPGDPEAKRTLTDAEIRAQIDPLPPDTTGKEQAIDVKGGKQVLDFKLESKSKP